MTTDVAPSTSQSARMLTKRDMGASFHFRIEPGLRSIQPARNEARSFRSSTDVTRSGRRRSRRA